MSVTSDTSSSSGAAADRASLDLAMQRAWARLVDRADAIADDITLTLLDREKEWYSGAGAEIRADLRLSTREHVRRGIRQLAGLGSADDTTALWRETGQRRARQGVPLELVLNAYTVGTRVLWEALVRVQDDVGLDDHVLVAAGQRIWANLDVQNSVMSAAYRKESALLQRRDLQLQARLLDGLVEGQGADPAFAADVTDVLGVAADEALACVVAAFDGSRDSPLRNPDDRLDAAGLVSYWHVRGDLHFGLVALGSRPTAEIAAQLACCNSGRVGIASAPEGLAGFGTAFQLATYTADTIPRGSRDIAVVDDRLPQVLLAASPPVTNLLVRRLLRPLLTLPPGQSAQLLATARALCDHGGSPKHAAAALTCHRNTVIYRIRTIQELTGRSLADHADRVLFTLALMALDAKPPL